jgi:hypothetical protein
MMSLLSVDQITLLTWIAIGLFSVLVPIGIFVGRSNVRASRREIVRDLERLFHFAKADGRPLILPSFELVKYKYDPQSNPDRNEPDTESGAFLYYCLPVAMFVTLTFLGFHFVFVGNGSAHPDSYFAKPDGLLFGVITYAFLGGYVWSLQ